MHLKKIENLLALIPSERLDYFIRTIVQFKSVWAAATDEGYIIFKDDENDEIFPIWPHKEIAEICLFQEHKEMGASPIEISYHSFVMKCIPDMIGENVLFGVFYDRKRTGLAIEGQKLLKELNDEHYEIYGDYL